MPISPALLEAIADRLIEAATTGEHPPASTHLVSVAPAPDDRDDEAFDLGFKDLDGEHLALAILGFRAPAEWWAFGGITGGWAAPQTVDDEHESARGRAVGRPSAHPDAVRITSVFLVGRDDTAVCRMRFADGRSIDEPPASGFVVDAFRRSLGLPTSPPAVPVGELYTSMWLTLLVRAGDVAISERSRRLSWSAVVARHPGLSSPSRSRDVATPAGLASAVSRSIADLDWPEIRRWAMRGSLHPFVERDLARWMDEGMLARWIFAEMPPLHVLVDEAAQRLTPDAAAKLRDTVDLLVLRAEGDAA